MRLLVTFAFCLVSPVLSFAPAPFLAPPSTRSAGRKGFYSAVEDAVEKDAVPSIKEKGVSSYAVGILQNVRVKVCRIDR
jgi:hypothetical protein